MNVKSVFQSKTVWLQVVAVISMFLPVVGDWLQSNPVEFVSFLAALSVIVRFVTHGKVSIFSDSLGGGSRTNAVVLLCVLGMALGSGLTSCSLLQSVDVNGTVFVRDEKSGAKGGIDISPGEKPKVWFGLPIVHPDTGLVPSADEVPVVESSK